MGQAVVANTRTKTSHANDPLKGVGGLSGTAKGGISVLWVAVWGTGSAPTLTHGSQKAVPRERRGLVRAVVLCQGGAGPPNTVH